MIENCKVNDCQKRLLVGALESILDAEKEFREAMGDNWEGDPLSDACDAARELLGSVECPVTPSECPLCPGFSAPCGNTNCPQLQSPADRKTEA